MTETVAEALVSALRATGTQRFFGVPGGGSSLELIRAGGEYAVPFVLARHEGAAVIMAATTAELDGSVGVAITTKGPGLANAANGVAHAALDRCAVALISDGFSAAHRAYVTHQWFDQQAFLNPLVKAHSTLSPASKQDIQRLLERSLAQRPGPVHLELTAGAARAETVPDAASPDVPGSAPTNDWQRALKLLEAARKPVIVVGLEARAEDTVRAIRQYVEKLACPALVTYKAKGVIADSAAAFAGIFTGGSAEQAVVSAADLIILVGVDPVEFILQPWPYAQPVLEIARTAHPLHYVEPDCSLYGDLAAMLDVLCDGATPSAWHPADILDYKQTLLRSLRYAPVQEGLSPEQVVTIADQQVLHLPLRPRVTVDAGAHMFSVTTFWPCDEANDLLISNGLATMGYALPAGIAAALHDRQRPVLAFTGDGGLLMCLGELATAVEQAVNLIVVVFNDGALSLIDIKQQQRQLPVAGVRWPRCDFAGTMKALGGQSARVSTARSYAAAVKRALSSPGPFLIDVKVDPSGYPAQLRALRG